MLNRLLGCLTLILLATNVAIPATVTRVICDSGDGATASITYDDVTNVMSGFRATNNSTHPMIITVTNVNSRRSASRTVNPGASLGNVNANNLNINLDTSRWQVSCRWQ